MTTLENPPENPCFGCGPTHRRGLRLKYERRRAVDGSDEVVTSHVPTADEIGWPGLFHTGLHFTVLFEVSYWAALELGGRVHVAHGPQVLEQERLPRVGLPFTAAARVVAREGDALRIEARSATQDGRPLAALRTTWRPESRAHVERAGLRLPGYLLESMSP